MNFARKSRSTFTHFPPFLRWGKEGDDGSGIVFAAVEIARDEINVTGRATVLLRGKRRPREQAQAARMTAASYILISAGILTFLALLRGRAGVERWLFSPLLGHK